MDNREKELEQQLGRLRREKMDLEQKRFLEELLPKAQAAVGDTFVYRNNSYGGGRGTWDTFYRVVAFTARTKYNYGAYLIIERCHIDSEGKPSLELEPHVIMPGQREAWNHVGLLSFCVRCDSSEYSDMRARVLAALDNPEQMIAALADQ